MFEVDQVLKDLVDLRIQQCFDKVAAKHPSLSLTIPKVVYDINSARLGGMAVGGHTIRINPVFLNTYTDHYIEQTIGHECCHILVEQVYAGYKCASHGREWKMMMCFIGLQPDRCHDYKAPEGVVLGKPKSKYNYVCSRCGDNIIVGPKHHSNLQKGAILYHSKCGTGSKLTYAGAVGRVDYVAAKKAATNNQYIEPTVVTKQFKVPKVGTKLHDCYVMYMKYKLQATRQQMIALFVNRANCTYAGAQTYYNTLSKM